MSCCTYTACLLNLLKEVSGFPVSLYVSFFVVLVPGKLLFCSVDFDQAEG